MSDPMYDYPAWLGPNSESTVPPEDIKRVVMNEDVHREPADLYQDTGWLRLFRRWLKSKSFPKEQRRPIGYAFEGAAEQKLTEHQTELLRSLIAEFSLACKNAKTWIERQAEVLGEEPQHVATALATGVDAPVAKSSLNLSKSELQLIRLENTKREHGELITLLNGIKDHPEYGEIATEAAGKLISLWFEVSLLEGPAKDAYNHSGTALEEITEKLDSALNKYAFRTKKLYENYLTAAKKHARNQAKAQMPELHPTLGDIFKISGAITTTLLPGVSMIPGVGPFISGGVGTASVIVQESVNYGLSRHHANDKDFVRKNIDKVSKRQSELPGKEIKKAGYVNRGANVGDMVAKHTASGASAVGHIARIVGQAAIPVGPLVSAAGFAASLAAGTSTVVHRQTATDEQRQALLALLNDAYDKKPFQGEVEVLEFSNSHQAYRILVNGKEAWLSETGMRFQNTAMKGFITALKNANSRAKKSGNLIAGHYIDAPIGTSTDHKIGVSLPPGPRDFTFVGGLYNCWAVTTADTNALVSVSPEGNVRVIEMDALPHPTQPQQAESSQAPSAAKWCLERFSSPSIIEDAAALREARSDEELAHLVNPDNNQASSTKPAVNSDYKINVHWSHESLDLANRDVVVMVAAYLLTILNESEIQSLEHDLQQQDVVQFN
ncbi:hypothetical protein [Lentzea sp. NEAU-D7]|uniref:hypothetical protein n=1 Tax=Lentzea sp. NEAU-D7 TaxID=2994667 RepID=UPI00224A4B63|nr:hypothetical protein [Lentzea sp. NEAU-D7]MCX2954553.1 hypothetical protein [Lentzea sp. NEAU-D7]